MPGPLHPPGAARASRAALRTGSPAVARRRARGVRGRPGGRAVPDPGAGGGAVRVPGPGRGRRRAHGRPPVRRAGAAAGQAGRVRHVARRRAPPAGRGGARRARRGRRLGPVPGLRQAADRHRHHRGAPGEGPRGAAPRRGRRGGGGRVRRRRRPGPGACGRAAGDDAVRVRRGRDGRLPRQRPSARGCQRGRQPQAQRRPARRARPPAGPRTAPRLARRAVRRRRPGGRGAALHRHEPSSRRARQRPPGRCGPGHADVGAGLRRGAVASAARAPRRVDPPAAPGRPRRRAAHRSAAGRGRGPRGRGARGRRLPRQRRGAHPGPRRRAGRDPARDRRGRPRGPAVHLEVVLGGQRQELLPDTAGVA